MKRTQTLNRRNGFTLAEVLIALALLGVIATFSIPKVLTAMADHQRLSLTREMMATLTEACFALQRDSGGALPPDASFENIRPYLNSLQTTRTGSIDGTPIDTFTGGAIPCNYGSNGYCLILPNGSALWADPDKSFNINRPGNINPNQAAIAFHFDPDGKLNHRYEGITLDLYHNCRVRTPETLSYPVYTQRSDNSNMTLASRAAYCTTLSWSPCSKNMDPDWFEY